MDYTALETAKVFKALCDPIRVSIIKRLAESERCACDLTESLDIAQSKLSYHMKILCESGIIECWYQGKWTHYRISEKGSAKAIEMLSKLTDTSEQQLDKISSCF